MQKHEGNLEDGEMQQRGFTERSLNILLRKIVDGENKEKGEEYYKDATPLIKTMYIRDPSRSHFQIQNYYNTNEEYLLGSSDIKYDKFMEPKDWYVV